MQNEAKYNRVPCPDRTSVNTLLALVLEFPSSSLFKIYSQSLIFLVCVKASLACSIDTGLALNCRWVLLSPFLRYSLSIDFVSFWGCLILVRIVRSMIRGLLWCMTGVAFFRGGFGMGAHLRLVNLDNVSVNDFVIGLSAIDFLNVGGDVAEEVAHTAGCCDLFI